MLFVDSETEVETIINNTLKHLTVIHASLAHTRLSLRKPSIHNSLVTLTMSAAELLERLTAEADIQAQLVSNQAKAILDKVIILHIINIFKIPLLD